MRRAKSTPGKELWSSLKKGQSVLPADCITNGAWVSNPAGNHMVTQQRECQHTARHNLHGLTCSHVLIIIVFDWLSLSCFLPSTRCAQISYTVIACACVMALGAPACRLKLNPANDASAQPAASSSTAFPAARLLAASLVAASMFAWLAFTI